MNEINRKNAIETVSIIVTANNPNPKRMIKSIISFKANQDGFRQAEKTFRDRIIEEGFCFTPEMTLMAQYAIPEYAKTIKTSTDDLIDILNERYHHQIKDLNIDLEELKEEIKAKPDAELEEEYSRLKKFLDFIELYLDNELTDIESYGNVPHGSCTLVECLKNKRQHAKHDFNAKY